MTTARIVPVWLNREGALAVAPMHRTASTQSAARQACVGYIRQVDDDTLGALHHLLPIVNCWRWPNQSRVSVLVSPWRFFAIWSGTGLCPVAVSFSALPKIIITSAVYSISPLSLALIKAPSPLP